MRLRLTWRASDADAVLETAAAPWRTRACGGGLRTSSNDDDVIDFVGWRSVNVLVRLHAMQGPRSPTPPHCAGVSCGTAAGAPLRWGQAIVSERRAPDTERTLGTARPGWAGPGQACRTEASSRVSQPK